LSFIEPEASNIIRDLPEALLIINAQGELIYVNRAVETLTGFSETELIGNHVSMLMPPSAHRRLDVLTWLTRWADNPDPSQLRYLNLDGVNKNGTERRYRVRVSSFKSEQSARFLVIIRDVTEEEEASRRLQHARLVSDRILAIGDQGILTINESQTIEYWNKRAEQIFGYREEEILGQNISMLIPEGLSAKHQQQVQQFVDNNIASRLMGERGEIKGVHKDGHIIPLEASITKTQIEDRILLSAQVKDITARKQAEKNLHDSELRFRALFENAFEGMALLSVDGLVIEINKAARELLANDSVFENRYFWDLNWWPSGTPEDIEISKAQLKENIVNVFDRDLVRLRVELSHHTGSRDIDFSLIPVIDEDNKPLYILAEGRDLTALDKS